MRVIRSPAAVMAVLAVILLLSHLRRQRVLRRRYPESDFDVSEIGYESGALARRLRAHGRRY